MTVIKWYIPYAHGPICYTITNTHVTFVGGTYPGGIVSPIDLSMYTVGWSMLMIMLECAYSNHVQDNMQHRKHTNTLMIELQWKVL